MFEDHWNIYSGLTDISHMDVAHSGCSNAVVVR